MSRTQCLFACLFASVAALPCAAAVLVPVAPVPGASTTTVFAVNDSNVVVGSYIGSEDGIEHAFFGTIDGTYTSFDAGSGGTQARGINNRGVIAGMSNSQSFDAGSQPMFIRKPNGRIVPVLKGGGQVYGVAQGIVDGRNAFAGMRWDFQLHQGVAFTGRKTLWRKDVRIPDVHQASVARGINDLGAVVGSYFHPPEHGFVREGKLFIVVDYPGVNSTGTELEAINDSGVAVGQWYDGNSVAHSFVYDVPTATFTDILVNGATRVEAWGINNQGAVTVNTDLGAYLWCADQQSCPQGGVAVDAPVHAARRH